MQNLHKPMLKKQTIFRMDTLIQAFVFYNKINVF